MIDSSHSDSTQECEFDWQPQNWIDRHGSIAQRVQSRQRSTSMTMDAMSGSTWGSDSTDSTWGSDSTSGSDSTGGSDSTRENDSGWEPLKQTNVQRDAAQTTRVQKVEQPLTERIIWDTGD